MRGPAGPKRNALLKNQGKRVIPATRAAWQGRPCAERKQQGRSRPTANANVNLLSPPLYSTGGAFPVREAGALDSSDLQPNDLRNGPMCTEPLGDSANTCLVSYLLPCCFSVSVGVQKLRSIFQQTAFNARNRSHRKWTRREAKRDSEGHSLVTAGETPPIWGASPEPVLAGRCSARAGLPAGAGATRRLCSAT